MLLPVQSLPIDAHLDELLARLGERRCAVLTAAPGAGKSTRVPPALCDPRLLHPEHQQVLCLQPRRVAAVSLARRVAEERGWSLGGAVGYRVRYDTVGEATTRLWYETEGTLTRQLLGDPYLEGIGAVVLDEFHERSWHADLALAWCAELRRTVRPDLLVVVMSATMQTGPVAEFLGAPVLEVPGELYPVRTVHRPAKPQERLPEQVARVVREALAEDAGDLLVFLPGVGEIEACRDLLDGAVDAAVLPLHGSLPAPEQDHALHAGARRRVVLATNVAETSVTVDGVRCVIDSGQARIARFDPDRGLDELRLEAISRFSAVQRQGRAGRQGPGRCYKLDGKLAEARRKESLEPELRRCDLAPLVLACKRLHGGDTRSFPFFEAPEPERLVQAETLLTDLGFIAAPWEALAGMGRLLADLPVHPRLARLLLEAGRHGVPRLGAQVAALLGERDVLRPDRNRVATPGSADLLERLELLEDAERAGTVRGRRGVDGGALRQVSLAAAQLRRLARDLPSAAVPADPLAALPALLLAAYPDRVARRQQDPNRLTLVGGQGVAIGPDSCLHAGRGREASVAPLVVAYGLQGLSGRGGSRVLLRQGCEIAEDLLTAVFGSEAISDEELVQFDEPRGAVIAARRRRFRDLSLAWQEGIEADPAEIAACLAEALAPQAEAVIRSDPEAAAFLDRLRWVGGMLPERGLPEVDGALLRQVLEASCQGERRRDAVLAKAKLPLLEGLLGWERVRLLDELAPARLPVPSGNRIRLDYSGERPMLAVRVQELFGLAATPRLAGGRVPVLLHLLSPAHRPVQVTDDLASFWTNTWPQVRKDLRGRYPKHSWPEDPLAAEPEAKGSRRV